MTLSLRTELLDAAFPHSLLSTRLVIQCLL